MSMTPGIQETLVPQMDVTCPHCQTRLAIPPSQAGEVLTCPKCSGKFQAPVPTAITGTGYQAAPQLPKNVQDFANKKLAAGLCGILLGGFGVHKFILGFNAAGAIMLTVSLVGYVTGICLFVPLLGPIAMGIIGLIEGIMYLTKSDQEFYETYAVQKKTWF